jgi:3-dehydroquinate synthase
VTSPNQSSLPITAIERTFQVAWRHRVYFTHDLFAGRLPLLANLLAEDQPSLQPARALVVLDAGLARARPALLGILCDYFAHFDAQARLAGPPVILPGGEAVKNSWTAANAIHLEIDRRHIDRHSYVVAIGGGALLDVVGFAAATAHRGCRHLRLPTTTLSQADSGVGVKNGINAFGKKNFIGTFAPPAAVINDFSFLHSLEPRDRRAGSVEAVKVALIRDASFFQWIEQHASALRQAAPAHLHHLVQRCAELHVNHITGGGDPFESGTARPLDFGHWSAHKLEQLSNFRIRHAEAVAIGIALDSLYSHHAGFLDSLATQRILSVLEHLGFTLTAPELSCRLADGSLSVLAGLEEFREHLGGQLTLTLLRGVGEGFETHDYRTDLLPQCIAELENRPAPPISQPQPRWPG